MPDERALRHLAVIDRRLQELRQEYLVAGRGIPLSTVRLEWHLDHIQGAIDKAVRAAEQPDGR